MNGKAGYGKSMFNILRELSSCFPGCTLFYSLPALHEGSNYFTSVWILKSKNDFTIQYPYPPGVYTLVGKKVKK